MSVTFRGTMRRYFERVETEEPETTTLPTNVIDEEYYSYIEAGTYATNLTDASVATGNDTDDANNTSVNDDDNDNNDNTNNTSETDTIVAISVPTATVTELSTPLESIDIDDNSDNDNNISDNNNEFNNFTSLREAERRRDELIHQSNGIALLGSYILMMLWLQALSTNNISLVLITSVVSYWFISSINTRQERIHVLEQVITDWDGDDSSGFDNAIRLSRRHCAGSGVGEVVKKNWDSFQFNSRASLIKKENFGCMNSNAKDHCLRNIPENGKGKDENDNDPENEIQEDDNADILECSICLGEYEKGDELVSLNPCRHIFHKECISSWTNHNTRCPLCNIDLYLECKRKPTEFDEYLATVV